MTGERMRSLESKCIKKCTRYNDHVLHVCFDDGTVLRVSCACGHDAPPGQEHGPLLIIEVEEI